VANEKRVQRYLQRVTLMQWDDEKDRPMKRAISKLFILTTAMRD